MRGQSDFLLKNKNTMHLLKGIELNATDTVTPVCTYLQFLLWLLFQFRVRMRRVFDQNEVDKNSIIRFEFKIIQKRQKN